MSVPRPWGCPKCGGHESMVAESSRDLDGYVVRIRKCNRIQPICDGQWETEERPMTSGSFWGRADGYRAQQRAIRLELQATKNRCRFCGGEYLFGQYNIHVARSKRHAASIKPPANGSKREKVRAYQRKWAQRKRDERWAA